MHNLMGYIQFPERLSSEEQNKYFELFNQTKSEVYRNLLIEHNLGLVRSVVYRVKRMFPMYDEQELFSIGCEGLIKAVEKYDLTRASFSTFAVECISNEINHYFEYNGRIRRSADVVSLYDSVCTNSFDDSIMYMDVIKSKNNDIEDMNDSQCFIAVLNEFLQTISERDRIAFEMYYGLNGYEETTQEKIAKVINIKRQYVGDRNKVTLRKFKKYLVSVGFSSEEEFTKKLK